MWFLSGRTQDGMLVVSLLKISVFCSFLCEGSSLSGQSASKVIFRVRTQMTFLLTFYIIYFSFDCFFLYFGTAGSPL